MDPVNKQTSQAFSPLKDDQKLLGGVATDLGNRVLSGQSHTAANLKSRKCCVIRFFDAVWSGICCVARSIEKIFQSFLSLFKSEPPQRKSQQDIYEVLKRLNTELTEDVSQEDVQGFRNYYYQAHYHLNSAKSLSNDLNKIDEESLKNSDQWVLENIENIPPQPQPNFGNSCFLNAALQTISSNKSFYDLFFKPVVIQETVEWDEVTDEVHTIIETDESFQSRLAIVNAVKAYLLARCTRDSKRITESLNLIYYTLYHVPVGGFDPNTFGEQADSAEVFHKILDAADYHPQIADKEKKILEIQLPPSSNKSLSNIVTDTLHRVQRDIVDVNHLEDLLIIQIGKPNPSTYENTDDLRALYDDYDRALERFKVEVSSNDDLKKEITRTEDYTFFALDYTGNEGEILALYLELHGDSIGRFKKFLLEKYRPKTLKVPFQVNEELVLADGAVRYRLTANVIHLGGNNGGHYVGYTSQKGKWYHCDDTHVREVQSSEQVNLETSRLLVFEKIKQDV